MSLRKLLVDRMVIAIERKAINIVYGGLGSCAPAATCAFVRLTSALVTLPLAFTSVVKFDASTVPPDATCALTKLTSALITAPLRLASPTSTPIVPEALAAPMHGMFTPLKLTVRYWAFATPVRLTVHWFALGPLLTVPVLAEPQLDTGAEKVKTIL